jgi:DNA-binding response OmpR family regulator
MAKLLLIEKDPVAAAVLEDRLRVAGHQVEMLGDAAPAARRMVGAVDEHQIDLVMLDVPGGLPAALSRCASCAPGQPPAPWPSWRSPTAMSRPIA